VTGPGERRDKIRRVAAIGGAAQEAATRIRAGGHGAMLPAGLAQAADEFLAKADALAQLAEAELVYLEEARDQVRDLPGAP
jgi:hypothetical protein